MMHGQKTIK